MAEGLLGAMSAHGGTYLLPQDPLHGIQAPALAVGTGDRELLLVPWCRVSPMQCHCFLHPSEVLPKIAETLKHCSAPCQRCYAEH